MVSHWLFLHGSCIGMVLVLYGHQPKLPRDHLGENTTAWGIAPRSLRPPGILRRLGCTTPRLPDAGNDFVPLTAVVPSGGWALGPSISRVPGVAARAVAVAAPAGLAAAVPCGPISLGCGAGRVGVVGSSRARRPLQRGGRGEVHSVLDDEIRSTCASCHLCWCRVRIVVTPSPPPVACGRGVARAAVHAMLQVVTLVLPHH